MTDRVELSDYLYESADSMAKASRWVMCELEHSIKAKAAAPMRTVPPSNMSTLNAKLMCSDMLQVCARKKIPPPGELCNLVAFLFSLGERRRNAGIRNRRLYGAAVRAAVETGKSGRQLAAELKSRGINAPPRTIATYCARPEFKEEVELLRGLKK